MKYYNAAKDFDRFEKTIAKEEEAAKKDFETTLKQNLFDKKVVARAGKGSVGQTEQDYTIDVINVKVTYMSDKFYIVLTGSDEKDYYLNTEFQVKILGPAEKKDKQTPQTKTATQPSIS